MPKHYTRAELEKKKAREQAQQQKQQANQNPLDLLNPENPDSNSGDISSAVTENIQPQESFASRAASKLTAANEAVSARRGRPPKAEKDDATGDFANLLSSVIVIAFAFTNLNEELKPTPDETGEVSLHVAKIIMRHVDISGKLTGDALDAIGIITVIAAYSARVAPLVRAMREQKQGEIQQVESGNLRVDDYKPGIDKDTPKAITPIEQASPLTKNWLDKQAVASTE